MSDIIIRYIDLPYCVKAVTLPSPDGVHNIYINTKYSQEEQKKALLHELAHIKHDDFCNFDYINDVEQRAKYESSI